MTTQPIRLDEEFLRDPHQLYERLRADVAVAPALLPHGLRVWIVSRYDDAKAALADPRLLKNSVRQQELSARQAEETNSAPVITEFLNSHMLNTDPPDHTRLRKLVNKAFTSRRVASLRPRMAEITERLLDVMPTGEVVDLVDALAYPLPITVICELLGVPEGDRSDFRAWSATLLNTGVSDEDLAAASTAMVSYIDALVAAKEKAPGEDLISALVEARESGDRLSADELRAMVFVLLVGGHETMVNLIGNGTLALLTNPAQLAALRDDPSLLPAAIEEFLRYEGPVNFATFRFTDEAVTIGGVTIPEGEFVVIALVSANRDATRFPDADTVDIGRSTAGHLAFGHGVHYCVGAHLARAQAEVAFGQLIARFPSMRLAVDPSELTWRHSTLMRGLESLPVTLG
ncbi:cytochrome P450 family protein [Amycolatopsis sp. CA-230715]|uniref:cytochrome P450 family protein n=1 Tax=Amycolatopsis sp. CA-230715 TaxID=2745196 RepID=UPI001C34073C|nr:cytochrome P450 [Amycolatopsis sp. CA-230715]QWF82789.1 Cytochrome P450 107B1 [Amycolatopsis sp. CA-230715]